MSGSEPTDQSVPATPKMTPQEYYQRQSAESAQANQKLEVLDKIRTSNMIFRGQKQLHQLVELKNRLLFGKEAVEAVATPEDVVQFDCKTEHHYHQPAAAPSGLASALKIGAGVLLAGTGIGSAIAIPTIASGVLDMMKPAAVAPSEPATELPPTVNIGGQEYQLELGEPDKE